MVDQLREDRPVRAQRSGRAVVFALLCAAQAICAACGGRSSSDAPTVTGPTGSVPATRPALPQTYRASGHSAAGDTFVQLFEWYWTDVAAECGRSLGPAGYRAALVSPPEEHNVVTNGAWAQRYGPVSYSIDKSQGGTKAEFADMVAKCRAAGVDIYVDAVINHMAPGSGTGSNGTVFSRYNYQPLYGPNDFHPACALTDYQSAANVQDCELLGLPDLNTGSSSVRQKIADYLVGLVRLGVAGFRIDAAKHIQPVELDSIVAKVNRAATAEGLTRPYFFLEVIDPGTEAVKATDYFGLGYDTGGAADITEFNFRAVGERFRAGSGKRAGELSSFTQRTWGLMAGDKAVVFLENHDTQRSSGIDYVDGAAYRLANVWMLGQDYGYPVVMSGYAFDRTTQSGRDAGPPAPSATVNCAASFESAVIGQWTCEHRDPWIAAMVGFRKAVAGTAVSRTWDNSGDAVAFTRGSVGFVAINNGTAAIAPTITTGLAAGTYCDLLTGGKSGSACAGRSVVVAADGTVTLTLGAQSAVVIHAGTKL